MNQTQPVVNPAYSSFAEQALAQVTKKSPVINRTLDNYGSVSLTDYLRQILPVCTSPLQPRDDLLEVVYHYAAPLLGETVAEKVAQELRILPAVLTVNHHGVDFLAQSVQSSLLFSLREVGGKPATTVPVFACGNIPLDNPTYPRGFLLYHLNPNLADFRLPLRIPIFCNRYRRKLISVVDAYNVDMLDQAEQCLTKMVQHEIVPTFFAKVVKSILDEEYRNKTVLELKNYSQQAVVLNNRILKRCFSKSEFAPEIIYLELEKITSLLLQIDLNNEDSLTWQVMFNPTLRSEILRQLDGVRACWDQAKLAMRISLEPDSKNYSRLGCGTVFFWAINDDGLRVPLLLTSQANHTILSLQGRDDQGKTWYIPFSPQGILMELKMGRLLPSLFTCFLTIAFARGVSCFGGYFQTEYLSAMQRVLIETLLQITEYAKFAAYLSEVKSDLYFSGMQTVMRRLNKDLLLPAGPIEIIARGGLSKNQLDRLGLIKVKDAHLAGLIETLPDFQPKQELPNNWCLLLAEESSKILSNQIQTLD